MDQQVKDAANTAYAETRARLEAFRERITDLRKQMRALQAKVEPQPVADYVFDGWSGPVKLSELFGGKRDLFVIHNMGTRCVYCTMWADGFNGVYDHLADRAAFVLATPNTPEAQKQFAASRGWRFPMVSHANNSFTQDMGFWRPGEDAEADSMGSWFPGVSVFQKRDDGSIVRVSDAELGPLDDFCSVWHFLDLMPEGAAGWGPKYKYG
jgi:predicted dithiol-disulfide oxidoreductase (DUF899 family)